MKRKLGNPPKKKVIRFNPNRIQKTDIKIPNFNYEVIATAEEKTTFTGHVTIIPTVLIFYLHAHELKVAATIMQEIMENGQCLLTTKQFCVRLKISIPTLYATMKHLRRLHVITEQRNGWKIQRGIDFKAVQHLNDIVSIEDRGIYTRLRAKCKDKNIEHITKDDIKAVYDQYVLPPDHDIEEEEEYD